MKRIFSFLILLCMTVSMLCHDIPVNADAVMRVYHNGTYAVMWVRDGYILLYGVEETARLNIGYLLREDELNAALPQGSAPLKHGDLIRIPETCGISNSVLEQNTDDILGYGVCAVRRINADGDLTDLAGTAERIGSVYDDPEYCYYVYRGLSESRDYEYLDQDGNLKQREPIPTVCLVTGERYRPSQRKEGGRPASCDFDTEAKWTDYQESDWVCMVCCQGVPLFPQKRSEGVFSAVIGETEDGYSMQNGWILDKAAVKTALGAAPEYGDVLYCEPSAVPETTPAKVLCSETSIIEKVDTAERFWHGSVNLLVTGTAPGSLTLADEAGTGYSYSYRTDLTYTPEKDPSSIQAGEIWSFAFWDDTPRLPVRKIADQSEEQKPANVLIVESVTPERCILQRHSIRQSFGAMIREDYQDIPIRFDTFHVASALGSYPEAGDILEIREDTAIAQYRKSPCYVGTIGFADGSQKQPEPGMLRRIGNILESGKVSAFDIHVIAGTPADKNSSNTWHLRNGSFTDTYIAWNPAWKQVKTGDVVSFGMYYDYPVMPLPAEQGYEHTYLAVESIGAGECILRNQEYGGVRMPYDLLITCLGEEPRLGDVLELMPEAHFVTEPVDIDSDGFISQPILRNVQLYDTIPAKGMLQRVCNLLEDAEVQTYTIISKSARREDPWMHLSTNDSDWWYACYSTDAYPQTLALQQDELELGDVIEAALFNGMPMLAISVPDCPTGDLDRSGSVDIMDVILLNKFILGSKRLSKTVQKAADLNNDGNTDAVDSLLLLKQVLEMQE